MRGDRVPQHQGVLALLVPEEVVDPLLLEQPLHEVKVGLAVLHAQLAGPEGVASDRARLDVGDLALRQHGAHDPEGGLRGTVARKHLVAEEVFLPGKEKLELQHLHRALDFMVAPAPRTPA